MKVQDIYNLNEGLLELIEKELPVHAAFKLQRIIKKINEELETAEKTRVQIIEKHKEQDLDDGQVKLKKEELDEFNQEQQELMDQEVELNVDTININSLGDISVTPKTLGLIDSILIDAE